MSRTRCLPALAVVLAVVVAIPRPADAQSAKYVILMIADGQGFNTIRATDCYAGSTAVFESFDVKLAMQTTSASNPAGYDGNQMASSFTYAKSGATDSASAATAMYTGQKVYDGRINWSTAGQPLTTYFEQAAGAGRSIGAVTSVEISHATPAAVYAHNSNRDLYAAIANEGIYGDYSGNLKVLMGAGNGDYNSNGVYDTSRTDNYVGGSATWYDMKDADGANGFTFVDSKAGFEALATGATPDKVLGIARTNTTLQFDRSGKGALNDKSVPYDDPLLTNVPSLATMARAALNVLDNDSDGFALMIEGGAVDWANHAELVGRMIEEQIDYNAAVQSVVDWVNDPTNDATWANTLLICTADHETGYLWGDGTAGYVDVNNNSQYDDGVDYGYVADNGDGNLPGVKYYSTGHANALVPVFAKGAGADRLADWVIGTDVNLAARYNLDASWTGQYIDNTSIYQVMLDASALPEPTTLVLLAAGAALLRIRPKRRSPV